MPDDEKMNDEPPGDPPLAVVAISASAADTRSLEHLLARLPLEGVAIVVVLQQREALDEEAFPAVALAKRVGEAGATYPAVFNAANEQAVAAFHAGCIGFLEIVDTIERVVEVHVPGELTLEGVLDAESWARRTADAMLAG